MSVSNRIISNYDQTHRCTEDGDIPAAPTENNSIERSPPPYCN